jgi:hypothetical protein
MSAQGGDARNVFGEGFAAANYRITPMLRAQFPDRFTYPILRVSDALTVHFTDPGRREVVVETAGMKSLVDVERTTVNGVPATQTTSPTRIVTPQVSQDAPSEVPVHRDAREGAFFGSTIVNLPNGKPVAKGGVDFFIGHRFSENISSAGLAGLFGFDSAAAVEFGAQFGVTDRLSFSAFRTNVRKTIVLGSGLQLTRQDASMPLTLQFRAGVEAPNNFGIYDTDDNPEERQYSPHIHLVMTRSFNDRFSFSLIPMFTFNTRDELFTDPELALGAEHNNTISLGIGMGYRFLPSTSIVGEYIPRLWGFKSRFRDFPGISKDQERISVGLQKSTFRHTFELVVSRQLAMTPAQYAVSGVDTFRVGFNIYRKLR